MHGTQFFSVSWTTDTFYCTTLKSSMLLCRAVLFFVCYQLLKTLVQHNFPELLAFAKSTLINSPFRHLRRNVFESTGLKRRHAYLLESIRKLDVSQVFSLLKCVVLDLLRCRGKSDVSQSAMLEDITTTVRTLILRKVVDRAQHFQPLIQYGSFKVFAPAKCFLTDLPHGQWSYRAPESTVLGSAYSYFLDHPEIR